MNKKEKILMGILLILSIAVIIVSLFSSGLLNKNKDNNAIYTLYVGLTDKDAGIQTLELNEALDICRTVLRDNKIGYTEHIAYAEYPAEEEMLYNDTIIYEFFFTDESIIKNITQLIAEQLNTAAISFRKDLVNEIILNLY